jgi:UDP-N-acetyl-D-mannosaminuronic acid dehydrogenase
MKLEKISIFGLGYIGLPTAAALATQRTQVIGIDVNESAVNTINEGKIHIVEPELDVAVQAAVSRGYLRASTTPELADAFIIAVPTPFHDEHQPNLDYIEAAASAIAPVLEKGNLVILESTSPVGTTSQICEWLATHRPDLSFPHNAGEDSDIRVAYCPERVLPGKVMYELAMNDRVIGGITNSCSIAAQQLYKIFVQGDCVITDAATAELCKLTENAMRDVNIAFANELSLVCDKLDISVWELIKLANLHPRIDILQPGPGVGGHCIAVDPWFIISQSPELTPLMQAARGVNDGKPKWIVQKFNDLTKKWLEDNPGATSEQIKVACFGLAFKANIDDLRESPALNIALEIATCHPGQTFLVEPNIEETPAIFQSTKAVLINTADAIRSADILVLLVDHDEFTEAQENWKDRHIIDSRGLWTS